MHVDLTQDTPARPARRLPAGAPRVSVVVPTLNEAANLPHVFPLIPEDVHEVIVVDGHSTDDTVKVARTLRSDVRIVLQNSRGKGNALACGFAAATGEVIVMIDADGSTDPREIPAFVQALVDGADFAKGTRFGAGGGSSDITWHRDLGNRALNAIVNVLFRTKYTDLCYGYNAFWAHCLAHMQIDCDGFEVETVLNIRALRIGLRIAEIPSFEAPRVYGTGRLRTIPDGWRVLKALLREAVDHHLRRAVNEPVESRSPAPIREAA